MVLAPRLADGRFSPSHLWEARRSVRGLVMKPLVYS